MTKESILENTETTCIYGQRQKVLDTDISVFSMIDREWRLMYHTSIVVVQDGHLWCYRILLFSWTALIPCTSNNGKNLPIWRYYLTITNSLYNAMNGRLKRLNIPISLKLDYNFKDHLLFYNQFIDDNISIWNCGVLNSIEHFKIFLAWLNILGTLRCTYTGQFCALHWIHGSYYYYYYYYGTAAYTTIGSKKNPTFTLYILPGHVLQILKNNTRANFEPPLNIQHTQYHRPQQLSIENIPTCPMFDWVHF